MVRFSWDCSERPLLVRCSWLHTSWCPRSYKNGATVMSMFEHQQIAWFVWVKGGDSPYFTISPFGMIKIQIRLYIFFKIRRLFTALRGSAHTEVTSTRDAQIHMHTMLLLLLLLLLPVKYFTSKTMYLAALLCLSKIKHWYLRCFCSIKDEHRPKHLFTRFFSECEKNVFAMFFRQGP